MLPGASALGSTAFGGMGAGVSVATVDCAAQIAISSSIQASITRVTPGYINIAATITIVTAIQAALGAAATFPDPGVSFSISDVAGGASHG